ncbi:MAG TPA: response regulator transcription factor [Ktedonobacterales bacterium]|nr:response regulator transcription factor [Ktedonobacterales bacterium]
MRVYILAAYPAVRAGLAALLREQADWRVIGQAAPDAEPSAASAALAPEDSAAGPDVLLADLDGLPDAETLADWLAALRPRGGVAVIGPAQLAPSREPGGDAARLLADIPRLAEDQDLAFGILRRDATPEEIVAALTAVAGGLITLDRRLASSLLAPAERSLAPTAARLSVADETLTARELEVLQLLAQGLPNKLIAQRLRISEHTAKFHVSAIMMKLGAASRTEAVTLAARRGLLIL